MADGPTDNNAFSLRKAFLWTEIFRCFQVALDPRKLVVAGIGVLLMSFGWYVLSISFEQKNPPKRTDERYNNTQIKREFGETKSDKTNYSDADYTALGNRKFERDLAEWRVLHDLAGENGRLRTLPWYEYRGPNPFLLAERFVSGNSTDIENASRQFLSGTVPVLIEPLRKILIPVFKLLDPNASFLTRVYLLLALIWNVVVWAFCGGVITRLSAVQFAGNKERMSLMQAIRFVASRYKSYILSPLVPICVIGVIVIAMAFYGLIAMIPILGDVVLYGLGMPLVFIGGIAIAILLVGMIGYPMMYPTISTEGTDTFDALSRSYNYVFQAPWSYLWYNFVAILYGAAVTLFVVLMGSMIVYMGKWAVSQAPWSESTGRKPDFLFIWAPESFGWKELLLEGSPIAVNEKLITDPETGRPRVEYVLENEEQAAQYRKDFYVWNWAGAGMVTFWVVAMFLLVIGFGYSYFWSAATMVYLLMRKKVDETDLDEIYTTDEALNPPFPSAFGTSPPAPPSSSPMTAPSGVTSLPTVTPPTSPPAAPAPTPSSPPASTSGQIGSPPAASAPADKPASEGGAASKPDGTST